MPEQISSNNWSHQLGLVEVNLLARPRDELGHHVVLLDGSSGSFILSESVHSELSETIAANWSWSADLPHHVLLNNDIITVLRWDNPSIRRFSRRSVEDKIQSFYEYLLLDKVQSRTNVIDHSIDVFRRLRSYMKEKNLPDDASISVFLFLISAMISGKPEIAISVPDQMILEYGLNSSYIDVFRELENDTFYSLLEQFKLPWGLPRTVEVKPDVLVRHAGGTVFQEAHFEFVRGGPIDMFGFPSSPIVRVNSRGGTHFTPPGLARSLIEQVFRFVDLNKTHLSIFDPACGAGSFLHETLRYLQRARFTGTISINGYDVSANAVEMTKFVLRRAIADWPEALINKLEIRVQDSVSQDCSWPEMDIVLMNPPFISWGGLSIEQREQLRTVLGKYYTGKPDYSMAFIQKAINSLAKGGVLGTLLPASLLSLEASLKWRQSLLEETNLEFLALLGDHTLFRHAIVEVAAGVFVKRGDSTNDTYLSLWSSERPGASSEALRNLRQYQANTSYFFPAGTIKSNPDWRISSSESLVLNDVPDWRPKPSRLDRVLAELRTGTNTVVDDVFHVREGIRAGHRRVFILNESEVMLLPKNEQQYFRPIAENKNIRNGRIGPHDYIFYPDSEGLEEIRDEQDLIKKLPRYYREFLVPKRTELSERKGLQSRNWWILNRHRDYFVKPQRKLVSTFFGKSGSFAFDSDGNYVVVQGFAWFPRTTFTQEIEAIPAEVRDEYLTRVNDAYVALLNSRIFMLLLAEFCPHVAGGQFNLSKRFVGHIPLPNLAGLGRQNSHFGFVIEALAKEGFNIRFGRNIVAHKVDELVSEIYRTPRELWPHAEI